MIEFRPKNFSLAEGHYTGPKDMDKVPGAIEVVGKSALAGALAGTAVGAILKDTSWQDGAWVGTKVGGVSGILLKIFINYLHKPMTKVKFQEVDRKIRREFGIYRAAGITIGDGLPKRADIDARFGFSDRNVTDYKISFAVSENKVMMYTFDLTSDELAKVDKALDYYCKKYTGMEYTSEVINRKLNSYAVNIIFTNYQVISNFIMELSKELDCRINLLDSKAIIQNRLPREEEEVSEEEDRNFSVAEINRWDALKILGKAGGSALINLRKGFGSSFSAFLMELLRSTADKLKADELVKSGHPAPRESFGNIYLYDLLKKLGYIEGHHFSVSLKSSAPVNISLSSGLLIITADKGETSDRLDKKWYRSWSMKMGRKDTGRVIVYTYSIQNRRDLDYMINSLMKLQAPDINLFDDGKKKR